MLLPEVGGCQITGPMPSLGSEFLSEGSRENKDNTDYCIALGCLAEFEVQTMLLNMPHTLVIGCEEIKLIMTRKFPG